MRKLAVLELSSECSGLTASEVVGQSSTNIFGLAMVSLYIQTQINFK